MIINQFQLVIVSLLCVPQKNWLQSLRYFLLDFLFFDDHNITKYSVGTMYTSRRPCYQAKRNASVVSFPFPSSPSPLSSCHHCQPKEIFFLFDHPHPEHRSHCRAFWSKRTAVPILLFLLLFQHISFNSVCNKYRSESSFI